MSRLVVAVLLALPLCSLAGPRVEGRIETDEGHLEILGQPVRVGETIELPEGYLRVEEAGTEDEQIGSFTVVSAQEFHGTTPAPKASADADAGSPAPAAAAGGGSGPGQAWAGRACHSEKSAYLRELWKMSGIELEDPEAVLAGLEAGSSGPWTGYYWFALATDPFRPLAWSSELRSRADALAHCVKAHGS